MLSEVRGINTHTLAICAVIGHYDTSYNNELGKEARETVVWASKTTFGPRGCPASQGLGGESLSGA
jgi:hypothetical protein